jgi:preprotein translocase subunit SecA
MTGTAREAAGEFWQTYRLPVVTIPPNRPCIRQQWPDRVFASEDQKWNAIADEAIRLHSTGRPLLIGTRSVAASERLASMLQKRGVDFRLLNAIRLHEEAAIVALAGERGHITIATNMAGRGTDIKLGPGVRELGGLHVIATERHESGRVDRQLFGRAARQGDPGSAQAFFSAEDELMRRYLPLPLQSSLHKIVATQMSGSNAIARLAITIAQRKAQALAAAQRRGVLRTDNWLEEALSFAGVEGV